MNIDRVRKKKTKKKLIEYINKLNKSEKLSDFKSFDDKWNTLGPVSERKKFINSVKNLIVLYNYTGNLYKFSLSLVVKNDCFFDEQTDFFKLSLKDMSNLLSLFIFQRFTKILGTEIIFFSLKKIKYKKEKVYFTYEGYFVVSEWYTETEKTKIITSIYSILSHIPLYGYFFFDDIKFNFQEINIKDFEKSLKKSSKNWKVDFIYWFNLSSPIWKYELDPEDLSFDDYLANHVYNPDRCRLNLIDRTRFDSPSSDSSTIKEWDNFLSNYLTDYNLLKKSNLIFSILNDPQFTTTQNEIQASDELEKIYIKYSTRLKSNNYLNAYFYIKNKLLDKSNDYRLYKNNYKSHYFIKMYYIYFEKNDLCIGWNGIYKFNPITQKFNYYCSFYKMYKNKDNIQRWINEIYNFYYIDEKYQYFTLIDFLKCRKELPRINFYVSIGLARNPFKAIKSFFLNYYRDYQYNKKLSMDNKKQGNEK